MIAILLSETSLTGVYVVNRRQPIPVVSHTLDLTPVFSTYETPVTEGLAGYYYYYAAELHMRPLAALGFFAFRFSKPETEDYDTPFSFSPFNTPLPFWWNGRLFLLERNGRSKKTDDPFVLTLRCLGSTENIRDLLEECRRQYQASQDKCSVFNYDDKGEWYKIANLNPRDLSTIVLPAGLKDELVNSIQQYFSPEHRKWLENRGPLVRKSYLFYGPPGTGKSSLAQALAKTENLDLYVVDLQSLSNEQLSALFRSLPEKCVVLIEDVDDWQARLDSKPRSYVTMSGFQNVIDGASTGEAEVDKDMAKDLFLFIFDPPGQSLEKADQELAAKADQFGQKAGAGCHTPTEILSFLVEYKDSPDTALNIFGTAKTS
ncbi:P-loop containing nucleoside triphosphate hydrolase protein [Xylaria palmicola]|nr:P-loop containing nucleoside triphosphate hydrolase protein [Xylaria palmicola]